MLFKTFGDKTTPTILLLHGGGLSWWSWEPIVSALENDFHIVTAIIDGHGDDYMTTFEGIEKAADHLISYIDSELNGSLHAVCGLSIGAQIALELLSRREDIAKYAVIESALLLPIKGVNTLTVPMYKLFFGLIKQKWFSKLQAKSLLIPDSMFNLYFQDSQKMTRQSLINITLANGNYSLKDGIYKSRVNALILVGGKELNIMKKSATILSNALTNSKLQVLSGLKHGELSLSKHSEFVKLLMALIK